MKYTVTISFATDRDLTQTEMTHLLNACAVQVEEPQVDSTDPAVIGLVDADYSTKISIAELVQVAN